MNTHDIDLPHSDEAAAHMLPSDLKKFEFGEHVSEAFSIAVGNPDETSQPLFTLDQVRAAIEADRKRRDEDQQPFGYFRPDPFGWTHCAATDEGAIALYERPQAQGEPVGWQPIETAPHGEEVLLGWLEWDGAWKMEVSPASWGRSTKTASNISAHGQATHWMPLPEAQRPTEPVNTISDAEIREVFLANGFTIKPGHDDLKPYVYDAARALLARYGATLKE